ncbi:uncharacterized protein At4g33100 isoform X2 [Prosopis cineraria]|uniref:uncharacterized protein At4g33100 isoform X2 n=1 Tax=Prosopis cineraria TaxID=364024 RepID=UPI00240F4709|nr:uncharacterized protein At4g33100 isoform X2 [Prosopis cineraria]
MRQKRGSSSSTSPCAPLRDAYHNCFNRWYAEKFMKGQWDKEECLSEWEKYRACLSQNLEDKHLSRFLEAEGVVSSKFMTIQGKMLLLVHHNNISFDLNRNYPDEGKPMIGGGTSVNDVF